MRGAGAPAGALFPTNFPHPRKPCSPRRSGEASAGVRKPRDLWLASFAARRVRNADGSPQRIHDKGMQHMPGEEAWLVGERRASGEHKYCQPAYHQPLRTGPPATQGRTGPRPLRRPLLAWPAPPRAHDNDRIRLPAKPPPRPSERGKKESAKDRRSRHCPRSAAQSSPSSPAHRPIDARTAREPSADHSNKSAKVVLVPVHKR